MPLIQSRKYKTEQYVTAEGWQEMQTKGIASRFVIVDDEDLQKTVIERPQVFDEPKKEYDDITAAELKEELGEYPAGATKKELYELYISK